MGQNLVKEESAQSTTNTGIFEMIVNTLGWNNLGSLGPLTKQQLCI